FAVDFRDADAGTGGTLLLNGTVSGASVEMSGADDSDVLDASRMTVQVLAYGNGGDDRVLGGSVSDVLFGGGGNDTVDGGAGNNYIDGGAGANQLTARAGDDILIGGAGNDIVDAGAG